MWDTDGEFDGEKTMWPCINATVSVEIFNLIILHSWALTMGRLGQAESAC
jgi:hypothetical protein